MIEKWFKDIQGPLFKKKLRSIIITKEAECCKVNAKQHGLFSYQVFSFMITKVMKKMSSEKCETMCNYGHRSAKTLE